MSSRGEDRRQEGGGEGRKILRREIEAAGYCNADREHVSWLEPKRLK